MVTRVRIELGAGECPPRTVGGYAAQYTLALKLHPFIGYLLQTAPASSPDDALDLDACPAAAGRTWIVKFVAAYRAMDGLHRYHELDPKHFDRATGGALPTIVVEFYSVPPLLLPIGRGVGQAISLAAWVMAYFPTITASSTQTTLPPGSASDEIDGSDGDSSFDEGEDNGILLL